MVDNFSKITETTQLDELIQRSHQAPVILFKHSTTCPISTHAHREMERVDDVNLVVVQTARGVSNEIAQRTGVRHESPQTLVLRNGEVVWSASHYDITTDAVTQAIEANA